MNALKIVLILIICLASVAMIYLGFVFLIGSGFIFAGDIDLTEKERKAAEIWVNFGAFFGFVLMFVSFITLILSGKIANFILRLIGKESVLRLKL